jgi:hypothetical protein
MQEMDKSALTKPEDLIVSVWLKFSIVFPMRDILHSQSTTIKKKKKKKKKKHQHITQGRSQDCS